MPKLINRTGKYFIKYLIEQLKLEMTYGFSGGKLHVAQVVEKWNF